MQFFDLYLGFHSFCSIEFVRMVFVILDAATSSVASEYLFSPIDSMNNENNITKVVLRLLTAKPLT